MDRDSGPPRRTSSSVALCVPVTQARRRVEQRVGVAPSRSRRRGGVAPSRTRRRGSGRPDTRSE